MRRALALTVLLAACGPVSLAQAERQCFERARLAASPRGMIAVGATNQGPATRVKLHVSSDYIQGRDPAALYESCVYQKSGLPPSRPLYERPDWKG